MNLNAIYVLEGFILNAVESMETLPTVPPVSLHINGKPITLTPKRKGYEFMGSYEGNLEYWGNNNNTDDPIVDRLTVDELRHKLGDLENPRDLYPKPRKYNNLFIIFDADIEKLIERGIIDAEIHDRILELEKDIIERLQAVVYKTKKLGQE